MSKRTSLTALLAGAWALTMVAGFMAGRRSTPETDASAGSNHAGIERHGRNSSVAGFEDERRRRDPDRGDSGGDLSAARLDELLHITDRNDRARHFLDYIARLSDADFAIVAAELSTGPMSELRRSEYAMLLTEWAARDPYAATEYMQAYARSDWERETLLASWAARDPQAAFDWAASAGDEGETNNWVAGAMHGIAATDPDLARRLLEAMEEGPTRRHSLRRSATAIAALGAEGAGEWIEQINNDDFRREAARSVAHPLARGDAAGAGGWVASMSDVGARRDASEIVGGYWARNDLDSARQWVESLPEDTRTEAAEGVAAQYGRDDPQGGAQWLLSLGDNPDLDGARRSYLDSAYRSDPETAANMISTLSDQRTQTGYYHRVLGRWNHNDADAARNWVTDNAATLPDSLVARMLKPQR